MVARVGLVLLMAVGSVLMWFGVPLGLLYLVSQMVESTQPTMGPYLIVLFGQPIGMGVIGKGLGELDRVYGRLSGRQERRRQASWLKSMRGERPQHSGRWEVLDVVMIWSVSTCVVLSAIWFFFFAGSSLPTV